MKHSKFYKSVASLAVAAALCVGGMMPAFAADDVLTGNTISAKLQISTPKGTPLPTTETVTFDITPYAVNGSVGATGMGTATTSAVALSGAVHDMTLSTATKDVYTVSTADLVNGLTFPSTRGQYTYKVEQQTLTPTVGTLTGKGETYYLSLWVNDSATAGTFVVEYITVEKTTFGTNNKVEITNGKNDFVFLSDYAITVAANALTIENKYDASMAAGDIMAYSLNLTQAYSDTATSFTAYIEDSTGAKKPSTALTVNDLPLGTVIAPNGEFTISFTAGAASLDFKLQKDEKLVIKSLMTGTEFNALQKAAPMFKVQNIVLVAMNNTTLTNSGLHGTAFGTGAQNVGSTAASATFTTEYNSSAFAATGISANDMPFVMMAVAAAGALVMFAVAKSRKSAGIED